MMKSTLIKFFLLLAVIVPVCASGTINPTALANNPNEQASSSSLSQLFGQGSQYQNQNQLQRPAVTPLATLPGYIEAGLDYHKLNNGFGSWFGQYLNISKQTSACNTWLGEVHHQREFGENGTLIGLTNIHNFNDTWYTSLGVATSDRTFFWQKFSINATLYHKMLDRKQLVPYLGFIEYWWRTASQSQYLNPGFIYYFSVPIVLEGGLLLLRNNPGNVQTIYKYVAATQGEEKKHYITLRVGWGREGYLAVGPQTILQNFSSNVVTLTWRQWLTKNWGFNLIGETYHSRVYNRNGVFLGVFRDI